MTLHSLTLSIALPESVKLSQHDAQELLILRMLDEGRISQSQAAKSLKISLHDLLDLMARHAVPVVRYAANEWEREEAVIRSAVPAKRPRS